MISVVDTEGGGPDACESIRGPQEESLLLCLHGLGDCVFDQLEALGVVLSNVEQVDQVVALLPLIWRETANECELHIRVPMVVSSVGLCTGMGQGMKVSRKVERQEGGLHTCSLVKT